MGYPKNEQQELLYEYDFEKDGGAISQISLRSLVNGFREGTIVRGIEVRVKTAITSGGTPTVTLGNTSDPNGYMTDIFAVASLDAVLDQEQYAGALLPVADVYRIGSAANVQDLVLDIGTAALTAGKLEILIKMSSDGN